MKRYEVLPGDMLVSVMGTIGRVAIVPKGIERGIINPRLVKYKLKESVVLPGGAQAFMFCEVNQSKLLFAAQGSTMDGLNMQILGELPIAFPRKDEQTQILREVKKQSRKFDLMLNEGEHAINLLQERRTALISAAVIGKIDVRDWSPPSPRSSTRKKTKNNA